MNSLSKLKMPSFSSVSKKSSEDSSSGVKKSIEGFSKSSLEVISFVASSFKSGVQNCLNTLYEFSKSNEFLGQPKKSSTTAVLSAPKSNQEVFMGALGHTPEASTLASTIQSMGQEHGLSSAQSSHSLIGSEKHSFSQGLKNLVGRKMDVVSAKVVEGDIKCVIKSRDGSREKEVNLPSPSSFKGKADELLAQLRSGSFSGSSDLDSAVLKSIEEKSNLSLFEKPSDSQVLKGYSDVHDRLVNDVKSDVSRMRTIGFSDGKFMAPLADDFSLTFNPKSALMPTIQEGRTEKFTVNKKVSGIGILKKGSDLYVKGTADKTGKKVYKRLPKPDEMFSARDVRDIKRLLTPDAYKQIMKNTNPKLGDETLLKWSKRIDRWKKSGPISKTIAKFVEKAVINPKRLKVVVQACKNEYAMLYENLQGRFLENPGGITGALKSVGAEAKDVASVMKSQVIKVKAGMDRFKSLESKVMKANDHLDGACQDAVNILSNTAKALSKFESTFDPSSPSSQKEFETIMNTLNDCETSCLNSIGTSIEIVSNELVPLLVSDKKGAIDNSTKQSHIDTAQKKITGLEKMYMFISREMDNVRVPLLDQHVTQMVDGNSDAAQSFSSTLSSLKDAMTSISDTSKSKSEKADIAHDALYGKYGVSQTLSDIEGDGAFQKLSGSGDLKQLLLECKSVLGDIGEASGKNGDDSRLMGTLGTSRDPVLFTLATKQEELAHYSTTLTQCSDIQETLILVGNIKVSGGDSSSSEASSIRLSPAMDTVLTEFQKVSASMFSEKALTEFDSESWSQTSNQLMNVQEKVRGEIVKLTLESAFDGSDSKNDALDILNDADKKLGELLDSHAKFPSAISVGKADSKLGEVRDDKTNLFEATKKAASCIKESGANKLGEVFQRVVKFEDTAALQSLQFSINDPKNEKLFSEHPTLKPALETFISEAKHNIDSIPMEVLKEKNSSLNGLEKLLSNAAGGKKVVVHSVRTLKSGAVAVTINRDNFGGSANDMKEVVFSDTGMVRKDTNRFKSMIDNPSTYKGFLNQLREAASNFESINDSKHTFELEPVWNSKTVLQPKILEIMMDKKQIDGLPPAVLTLEGMGLKNNFTIDIANGNNGSFCVTHTKDSDGVSQLSVTQTIRHETGGQSVESGVFRVLDDSVSVSRQECIGLGVVTTPKIVTHFKEVSERLEDSLANLTNDLMGLKSGELKGDDLHSPFMLSKEDFMKEVMMGFETREVTSKNEEVLQEAKTKLGEIAEKAYATATASLGMALFEDTSKSPEKEYASVLSDSLPRATVEPKDRENPSDLVPLMNSVKKQVAQNLIGKSALCNRVQNQDAKNIAGRACEIGAADYVSNVMYNPEHPVLSDIINTHFSESIKGPECAISAIVDTLAAFNIDIQVDSYGNLSKPLELTSEDSEKFAKAFENKISKNVNSGLSKSKTVNLWLKEVLTEKTMEFAYNLLDKA